MEKTVLVNQNILKCNYMIKILSLEHDKYFIKRRNRSQLLTKILIDPRFDFLVYRTNFVTLKRFCNEIGPFTFHLLTIFPGQSGWNLYLARTTEKLCKVTTKSPYFAYHNFDESLKVGVNIAFLADSFSCPLF